MVGKWGMLVMYRETPFGEENVSDIGSSGLSPPAPLLRFGLLALDELPPHVGHFAARLCIPKGSNKRSIFGNY